MTRKTVLSGTLLIAVLVGARAAAQPVGTGFTYQGQLKQAGQGINGPCDFQFRLHDAMTAGVQIGATLTFDGLGGNPAAVIVANGLFTVTLDFGVGVFTGDQRFLEIAVRFPSGAGSYTTLSPRQPICAAPYALYALDSPPDFNLPLEATIPSSQDLLSLTNLMGGATGGGALTGRATGSSRAAIMGEALGMGQAGLFQSLVAGSTTEVLKAFATSDGTAILAEAQGSGMAGNFVIGAAANAATALGARTIGTGGAAQFEIQNPTNNSDALLARTNGLADAGVFEIAVPNPGPGSGPGDAVFATTNGSGRAGMFQVSVPLPGDNANNALEATTNGAGRASLFQVTVPVPANSVANTLESTTNGAGRAGYFAISVPNRPDNTSPALEAVTNGNGEGVKAYAPRNDGVIGSTDAAGTFNAGAGPFPSSPAKIIAGVHGVGGIGNSPDNWGVAGTGGGYGSGVLGIAAPGAGHGVVGVSGADEANRTIAGVWGMTRESSTGFWPPYFNIDGSSAAKGMVGVLGQAVNRVGVWGESIQKIGVVGTTGPATSTTATVQAGVYGQAGPGEANAAAAYFERRGSTNTNFNTIPSAAVIATTNNAGGPAGLFLKPSSGADTFPALYGQSIGSSAAAVFMQGDAFSNTAFSGGAVRVLGARNTGIGLDVQITNNSNASTALQVVSNSTFGNAARFLNSGTGTSDTVGITANTTSNALLVQHTGTAGRIARFARNAANTTGGGVEIDINGPGVALDITHRGTGRALDVEMSPASPNLCAFIRNNHPDGSALRVENVAAVGTLGRALDVNGPSYFTGEVHILGTASVLGELCATSVCASVKNFQIDHPLDPENRYLRHASVESDELKTLYDGIVVTDERGYATVQLPAWFEALNTNLRYQLTVVDEGDDAAFALAKVVRPVREHRFTIRSSVPRTTVSWQVTGVRHDAYALSHPLAVELAKQTGSGGRGAR